VTHHLPQIGILGMGMAVPERVVTNHDLEKLVDTSDEWITTRTGIKERRYAAEGEGSSEWGSKAALAAIKDAGMDPKDIDLIVCCTFTPDSNCPSTACHIKKKIGAAKCAALDVNAACTGL
jgi:3-oxoacyl-[acyl-carrier-protein] synthase-3